MNHPILKKFRLKAAMTQAEVAEAMNISQPNYQRWESGSAAVPKAKLKKLAKVLHATEEELLGKPRPFDLFGTNEEIGDEDSYFGEIAFHFSKGNNLLLPVTEAERSRLYHQLNEQVPFLVIRSLDNQLVFIRCAAIADMFLSSEAYDDFGPEAYDEILTITPHEDFWQIVSYLEDGEFPQERIDEVLQQATLSDEELDDLIANGSVKPENRERGMEEVKDRQEKIFQRATSLVWQLSSSVQRRHFCFDGEVIYESFSFLEIDNGEGVEWLSIPIEGYHRTVFINMRAIDYISVPAELYETGRMAVIEKEFG